MRSKIFLVLAGIWIIVLALINFSETLHKILFVATGIIFIFIALFSQQSYTQPADETLERASQKQKKEENEQ